MPFQRALARAWTATQSSWRYPGNSSEACCIMRTNVRWFLQAASTMCRRISLLDHFLRSDLVARFWSAAMASSIGVTRSTVAISSCETVVIGSLLRTGGDPRRADPDVPCRGLPSQVRGSVLQEPLFDAVRVVEIVEGEVAEHDEYGIPVVFGMRSGVVPCGGRQCLEP